MRDQPNEKRLLTLAASVLSGTEAMVAGETVGSSTRSVLSVEHVTMEPSEWCRPDILFE